MENGCDQRGQNIAFAMDAGSSSYWLSFAIKYEGGPGDIQSVMIRQVNNKQTPATTRKKCPLQFVCKCFYEKLEIDEDVKYFEEKSLFVFSQLSKFVDIMREITKIEGKRMGGKGKKTKKVASKKEGYIKNMMKKREMV
jgi:hypothetical protein